MFFCLYMSFHATKLINLSFNHIKCLNCCLLNLKTKFFQHLSRNCKFSFLKLFFLSIPSCLFVIFSVTLISFYLFLTVNSVSIITPNKNIKTIVLIFVRFFLQVFSSAIVSTISSFRCLWLTFQYFCSSAPEVYVLLTLNKLNRADTSFLRPWKMLS